MPLKIVIPSHKRHDMVLSKRLVVDPILCVAESQADIYREYNPECEIVTHPDDVVGLIPKRNWMGRTKEEFFREELEALRPRQPGLFDELV